MTGSLTLKQLKPFNSHDVYFMEPCFLHTICTVWLKMSLSAVMVLMWSISRCFREKNRSRRALRERHDVTLCLYRSFSLLTTERWDTTLVNGNYTVCTNSKNRLMRPGIHSWGNEKERWCRSPCLTVVEGYSLPCLMPSMAVCSAVDRSSAAFKYSTNCSAWLKDSTRTCHFYTAE